MVGSPPGSLVHQWSSWCTMVPNPPNRDPESPWRQRVSARPPPEHRTRTRSQISPEPWLPSIRIIRYQITNKMMNMMMIFFNSTMIKMFIRRKPPAILTSPATMPGISSSQSWLVSEWLEIRSPVALRFLGPKVGANEQRHNAAISRTLS